MTYTEQQLNDFKKTDPLFHAIVSFDPSSYKTSGALAGFLGATGKSATLEGLNAASQQAGLGNYATGNFYSSKNTSGQIARDTQIIKALQQQAITQKNAGTMFGQIPVSAEDQAAAARSGKAPTAANGYTNAPALTPAAPLDSNASQTPQNAALEAKKNDLTRQLADLQSQITPSTSGNRSLSSLSSPTSSYTGSSVVNYLSSTGQPNSFSARATLAAQNGISNYTGTAAQNTQLLNTLRSSGSTGQTNPSTGQPQTSANLALTQKRDALQAELNSLLGTSSSANPQPNGQQSTGDPVADKALAAVQAQIDTLKNTGYQIPAGLQITPDLVAKFLSIAHQNVDPETQQFLKSAITDINTNITNKGNQFLNSQGEIVQNFGTSLATEQNAAGGSGTAFSGQRAINEMNMANSTNRTLASLGSNTETDIGNTLRAGGANVGSANAGGIATPYFNLDTVGIGGGQRGNVSSGRSLNYNYDPSVYTVGAIPSAGITKANALRDSYLSQYGTLAGNQSNSGRSINDLIKGISGLPAGYTP